MSNQRSIGLDISDCTIEAVEVIKHVSAFSIARQARIVLPSGVVARGRIQDAPRLKSILNGIWPDMGVDPRQLPDIIFGLPESLEYTLIFETELSGIDSEKGTIENKLRATLPVDLEKLEFAYRVVNEGMAKKGKARVLAVASEKILDEWRKFFRRGTPVRILQRVQRLSAGVWRISDKPLCLLISA
jgi:Tfp pilus assembly PilM family ATPase